MSVRAVVFTLASVAFAGSSSWAAPAGLNAGAAGKTAAELLPFARFSPEIPSPEAFFSLRPGERPIRPDEVLAYFRTLADASPRAHLRTYAHSHEGRPLVTLAVGEAETIADLDAFREAHVERLENPKSDLDALGKAVAWMAYSIHGDEISGTDASAMLAYWLVAGEDDLARRLRSRLVVLIDPCENPDGRARYLAMTTAFAHKDANPDPDDLSHSGVWPWGRGNHYLFDLNRDWFSLVHPESTRSERIAHWQPQLIVDAHEMGNDDTYLFSPPRHPFNPFLAEDALDWARTFAGDQAAALDARGFPYYTREWNEEFFPGYGSSWGQFHGSIGILYEMSGTSGTVVRKRSGVDRSFAEAVEHQLASSVANLTTLADRAPEVLESHRDYRARARKLDAGNGARAWVFPARSGRSERMRSFATRLARQGVSVETLTSDAVVVAATDARDGGSGEVRLPRGSLRVRLDQGAGHLAHVLLDPHVPMKASFLREEREYIERGKGSRLYDTTAWSLTLLRGVDAAWTKTLPSGAWEPFDPSSPPEAVEPWNPPDDWVTAVFDGSTDRSRAALADLLEHGVRVLAADRAFEAGGVAYVPGTFLVPREANAPDVSARIGEIANTHRLEPRALTTFLAEDGPDLGGRHFVPLVAPRVAVLAGMPVSPSDYGSVWRVFDLELGLRFSGIDTIRIGMTDLGRYNVLVVPPSFGGRAAYASRFGAAGMERLRAWVRAGGTLVGLGSGAEFLAAPESALTAARARRDALAEFPPVVLGLTARQVAAAGRLRGEGIRPPRPVKDGAPPAAPTDPDALYGVEPIVGSGALPFLTAGSGGSLAPEDTPTGLDAWIRAGLPEGIQVDDDARRRADGRLRAFMPRGAILGVDVDPEHWMNWGLPESISVLYRGVGPFVAPSSVRTAARFAPLDRLHLGGLLWPEAAGRIAEAAYATVERVGRGQVVLFASHPTFRGWTEETERQFANTILYGPGVGTRWSRPW